MADLISIDAERAAVLVAMSVSALSDELSTLDKPSLELVLTAEEAKGNDVRSTAVAAITAAIDAIDKAEADAAAAAEAEATAKAEAEAQAAADAAAREAAETEARERAEADAKAAEEAKAAADAAATEELRVTAERELALIRLNSGKIRMRNADGTDCSYRGESYEAGEDGIVEVPAAAYDELVDHGFSHVAD